MLKAYSRAVARINSLKANEEGATATEYALVLGLVGDESEPKDVREKLGWSEYALDEVLQELEQAGLVERLESDDTDLDFTGTFSAARFAGAKKTA